MVQNLDISITIPFYNEQESLPILYERIVDVLNRKSKSFEIIFVDDGSVDNSYEIVSSLRQKDSRIKIIKLRSNCGKAKALSEGFKAANGTIVITMDADLQDDPDEIPNFLNKIEEGYDLVSGWKKTRHDPLEKRLPSKLFNKATSLVSGLKLHDFNCGFKAYKREILNDIKVYGELHRYVPALAHWQGYHVGEIPVKHYPREYGKSKYGLERYLRGFFDLFTVVLLTKFIRNPAYLFGVPGLFILVAGLFILSFLTGLQMKFGSIMGYKPLSYLGVLSILFGSQAIAIGLLSEMITNISQKKGRGCASVKNIYLGNMGRMADISVVIPVYNENRSLQALYDSLSLNIAKLGMSYEIIFIDDGSNDGSYEFLKDLYKKEANIKLIQLRKRFGKALALQAGFDHSEGKIIVTMDADLQDNPEEIFKLIRKIDKGYDFVVGRRIEVPFFRSLSSRAFNILVSLTSGVKIHDLNCGLKAFRRSIIRHVRLYGEFQRFFPIFAARNGFKIGEITVKHKEREYGKSKYGLSRIPKAFIDLFTVILLTGFKSRPLHLFGTVGVSISFLGFSINAYLILCSLFKGSIGGHYTLLLVGVMLMVLGLQWFSVGILSELINDFYEDEVKEDIRE